MYLYFTKFLNDRFFFSKNHQVRRRTARLRSTVFFSVYVHTRRTHPVRLQMLRCVGIYTACYRCKPYSSQSVMVHSVYKYVHYIWTSTSGLISSGCVFYDDYVRCIACLICSALPTAVRKHEALISVVSYTCKRYRTHADIFIIHTRTHTRFVIYPTCNMFTRVHLSREMAGRLLRLIGNRTISHVNNNKTSSVDSFSETLRSHTCIIHVHHIDATCCNNIEYHVNIYVYKFFFTQFENHIRIYIIYIIYVPHTFHFIAIIDEQCRTRQNVTKTDMYQRFSVSQTLSRSLLWGGNSIFGEE